MASVAPDTGSPSNSSLPNPPRMTAVVTIAAGGPKVLKVEERDIPILQPDEVLIKVFATCTNKIDTLERKEEANVILGHECSGHIVQLGTNVTDWNINDEVCALLRGRGYAEYVAVPSTFVFSIPHNVGLKLAATLPFLACSTFKAILECDRLRDARFLLIHDAIGFDEVGLFALRVVKALYKIKVIVVSVCDCVLRRYKKYNADYCIEYMKRDYLQDVISLTGKRGVDVVLNYGGYHGLNCQKCLAPAGFMMVVFDVQEKKHLELCIDRLRRYSTTIEICDLRRFVSTWSQEDLSEVVEKVKKQVWPLFEDGRLTCEPRFRVMPLSKAATAHRRMEYRDDEKIILTMEKKRPPLEKLTSMLTDNSLVTKMRAVMDSLLGDQIDLTTHKRKG